MTRKTCTVCEESKPITDFGTSVKDGYKYTHGVCRECYSIRKAISHQRHKERAFFDPYIEDAQKCPCTRCAERPTCTTECTRFIAYVALTPIPLLRRPPTPKESTPHATS